MIKYTKKKKVSELKDGDRVDDIFVVKFKKGMKNYAKGYFFELTLSDNSGKNIDYKYWGSNDEKWVKGNYDAIKADSIVHVQGKVSSYMGKLQLATNEPDVIEAISKNDYNESDFVKQTKNNIDEMYGSLLNIIGGIKNEDFKNLLSSVFNDKSISERFKKHPGAIEIHHGWIGGLLEHTLEVLAFCKVGCELYPQLDKDLVYAGAMLHDIGKLDEIQVTSRIKGTKKGQLTSHLVLSAIFVSNKCDELKIKDELKDKVVHIIVSHHGREEYGSPKTPMIPEAVIVYYADELSTKVSGMIEFIKDAKENTEDEFMYNSREKKNIYIK